MFTEKDLRELVGHQAKTSNVEHLSKYGSNKRKC